MTLLFDGELLADYHQVYLCDAALAPLPDNYTDEAIARRVMAGPQGIIIHTERNMTVPLRVELFAQRPRLDLARFDHVAECGFAAPSGTLVIAGLTDYVAAAARVRVPAGPLRALVAFENLGTSSEDGLEGDDRYSVHLWSGSGPRDVAVLRRWSPP